MKRVLVALDASPRAPAVLAAAAKLAETANASLVLFRAVGVEPEVAAAHAELARLAETVVPRAHVESVQAAIATPWDGICRTARDVIADLIAVGGSGPTSAQVVSHADRDVLVVRATP